MTNITINKLIIKDKNKTLVEIKFDIRNSTALVGQSGSGKSIITKAILGMSAENLTTHCDMNIPKDIALVPQNPFRSLSPLTKIKDQLFHDIDEAKDMFVSLDLDIEFLDRFPKELSGGQLQRVVLAFVLLKRPKLLLLDEPTTSLDKTNQKIILNIIKSIKQRYNIKILYITHDINTAKIFCDDIIVIKNGSIVEQGELMQVLSKPQQNYTHKLINSNFGANI